VKYPLNQPSTGGLTKAVLEDTLILPFNDLEGVKKAVKGHELALIIVEPVQGAAGFIPADKEFLKGVREICDETDTLLIFDEVVTGFRLAPGGSQELYGVKPDLTTLGKIMGGGLPIGAIAGRADIMEHMDHKLYSGSECAHRGGTGSGNVLAMTSGLATLKVLSEGHVYPHIDDLGGRVIESLQDIFDRGDMGVYVTGVGSLFACHFTGSKPVKDLITASQKDLDLSKRFHMHLVVNGVYCYSPETVHGGVCYAHTKEDIEKFLTVSEDFTRGV
jgi:glutamate-1-semialdehyde 2,1-aminomutase